MLGVFARACLCLTLPGPCPAWRVRSIGPGLVALACIAIVCSFSPAAAYDAVVCARGPCPSPDGSRIAFSYMGDIWTVSSSGGVAERLTIHEAYDGSPLWSPDGTRIAFTADREGNTDIYIVPAQGGTPERVTCHSTWDQVECWARDGSAVLFTSWRGGLEQNLFEVSVDGGLPTTVIADRAWNCSISPDGRWIAYVRGRTPWWRQHYRGSASRDIWIRAYLGGPSYRLTDHPGDDDRPMWSSDGRMLYFISERADSVMNVWKLPLRLPLDDEDGVPRAAGAAAQVTHHTHDGVQSARISADGSMIAYEWDAGIWTLRLPDGEPSELAVSASSDLKWNDDKRLTLSSGLTEFAMSPDEDEIAIVVRGEVFVCRLKDGEAGKAMRITETPAREKDVAWMPDGETLLYASDRTGNYDLYAVTSDEEGNTKLSKALKRKTVSLTDSPDDDSSPFVSPDGERIAYFRADGYLRMMDADGDNKEQLLPEPEVLHVDWSPDSKWIAISRTTMAHKEDIFVFPSDGGEIRNVSEHPNDDFQPRWTDDGKRLSFASRTDDGQYMMKYIWLTREDYWKSDKERQEEEEGGAEEGKDGEEDAEEPEAPEVRIDFENINERTVSVMNVRGGYDFYAQTPDGKYYAFRSSTLGNSDLWLVDWEGEHLTQVTEGGADPRGIYWSNDGTTCYYVRSGGTIATAEVDPKSGNLTGTGRVGFSVRLTVNVPDERRQMFSEAWRLLWNRFYDPEFHGVNWESMREKYEPLALAAYTDEEFRIVVREMIGELSASHLGIYRHGGGGPSTGDLGIRHDEGFAGPGVLVSRVVPDGPADRAGIVPGEYILSVGGGAVGEGGNYHCLLADTVDEEIMLEVSENPEGKSLREVRVRPVGRWTMRRLEYEQRVRDNRARVDSLSGGRLGYLHIPGMGTSNLRGFEEDLFARGGDREGLIIDIRGNGGGSVHDEILRYLDRRRYGYTTTRARPISYSPLELYTKPLALLIDESCYSDAEIFPMGWRALGLGPVVGTPTYGAVIGTEDVELIDGTMFRVPSSGWFDMDGRNLENLGIEPDIRVDAIPEERARTGGDIQLETAVRALLDELGG